MTDGHEVNKLALYAYRMAGLSQINNRPSQPGNIRYRPSLIALHGNEDSNQVLGIMESCEYAY